jgi:uncharacterized SAM-binding protein YcdF (DUF218 family)
MNISPVDDKTDDALAKILWDYNNFQQAVEKADCIFVVGNFDIRTAQYGAQLFLDRYAPLIIFSGDRSDSNRNLWNKPEAEVFAEEAGRMGVPTDKIILEPRSTNTGENILFTKQLIEEKGLELQSFIVVQKPFMLRRVYATFMKQWPGKKLIMTAPDISFDDYPNEYFSKEYIINIMVGDTQRVKVYAEKGFQIPQEIPDEVQEAYEELVRRGYTRHLIKEYYG